MDLESWMRGLSGLIKILSFSFYLNYHSNVVVILSAQAISLCSMKISRELAHNEGFELKEP